MRQLRVQPLSCRRLLVPACALACVLACDRSADSAGSGDLSRGASTRPDGGASPAVPSGWRADAGPVLLVAWPSTAAASVVTPDSQGVVTDGIDVADTTAFMRGTYTLLDRSGERRTARFGAWVDASDNEGCSPWPVAHLVEAGGQTPAWTVGFAGAGVAPVPLDSLAGSSRRDSTALAIEAARLASLVRRPVDASFRGLPFVVQEVYRFDAAPGVQALAALVVRTVNQEDSPREERTFLVAERDSGQTSGSFALAYDERASGPEETVESTDVLAALRFDPRSPVNLVIARDYGSTRAFALLEREGARTWRARWSSARMRC